MSRRKKKKTRYVLYALEPTEENILAVQCKRFYRMTHKYILLYEQSHHNLQYNSIGDSELSYLSDADRQWLWDCNMAIIAEETVKHRDDIASQMGLMVTRLEQALQEERSKEERDAGTTGYQQ